MPSDEYRVRIHRPASEVFEFVGTNVDRNNQRWESEVLGWSDLSPRPIQAGTTALMRRVDNGKRRDAHLVCTAFEADRLIAWNHTDPGPFRFAISFETVPVSERETDLVIRTQITLSGPLRLMRPLVKRQQAKTGARLTGRLAELLNSGATT